MVKDGVVDKNPCDDIEAPKDKKEHEIVYLTFDEIETVKKNIIRGVGNDLAKYRQYEWKKRN